MFDEAEKNVQFEITDDSAAEWAVKKVLEAQKERDRLLALVDAARSELDEKQAKIEKRCEADTAYLLSKLNDYLDTVERKKTKTQETYQLLSGKIIRKFPKVKLVPDDAALVAWCKENAPDYVRQTEKVMWSDVKDKFSAVGDYVIFAETGECVSCVAVQATPATLDVKGN